MQAEALGYRETQGGAGRAFVSSVRWAVAAVGLALAAYVIFAGFDKAWWSGVQGWGRPYWWLDYSHGLVRRGLAGQIFHWTFGHLPEGRLGGPVSAIHELCAAILAVSVLGCFARALLAQVTLVGQGLVLAVGLWGAAAQFWPTLAYNQGYLDSLTLAWAVCAALAFRARFVWVAGALMATGPFIHEYFAFLVPFILASQRMEGRPIEQFDRPGELVSLNDVFEVKWPVATLALAGVALVSCAAVTFGASADAARAEIAAMPISPADQQMLANTTLTQSFGKSLNDDLALLLQNPSFTLRNFAFFLMPSLVAVMGMLFLGPSQPGRALWLRAAAALFPVAALLLAWDLSRLLVMSNVTACLLFLMTAIEMPRVERRAALNRWLVAATSAALGAAALFYAVGPFAYVYYEPGPATLFPLKQWPGDGRSSYGFERLWRNAHNVALPDSSAGAPVAAQTALGS